MSDPFKNLRELEQQLASLREPLKSLRGLDQLAAFRAPFESVRGLERQLAVYRDPFKTLAHEVLGATQAFLGPTGSALRAANQLDEVRLLQERLAPLHHLSRLHLTDVFPSLAGLSGGLNVVSALGLDAATMSRLNSDLQTWRRGIADVSTQLAPQLAGWASSVQVVLDGARAAGLTEPLVARMLQPTTMLTAFSRSTAKRISASEDDAERARLESTVAVVESQVFGHVNDVTGFITSRDVSDENDFAPDRPFRLARREQVEMLGASIAGEDAEALVQASSAAHVHTLARHLLALLIAINEAVRLQGGDDIFKLTNRFAQGLLSLPWIDASNLPGMGVLVDDLYFLIYEAAGKDKLRFLKEFGGPLDTDDCEAVFGLKHLRNKWLRHDLEHGRDADIKKSYAQLRERFRQYGLDGYPRRAAEYRLLQRQLLKQMCDFLERLLASVSA